MIGLDINHNILGATYQYIRTKHNSDKILVFEKGNILFVLNWHPNNSYNGYQIFVKKCKSVNVLWSTDDIDFGGHGRIYHQGY